MAQASFDCSDYQTDEIDCLTTNDPTPIITANYYEQPVTIDSYSLFEGITKQDRVIPIDLITPARRIKFNFTTSKILLDGLYLFKISAIDFDGNQNINDLILAVDISDMAIWVKNPRISFISKEDQKIAIGKSLPFNLVVETRYDSVCGISQYNDFLYDLELGFDTASYYFNDNSNIASTTHILEVVSSENAAGRSKLVVSKEFDYSNPEDSDYIVFCKQEVGENKYNYSYEKIYVGYDDTPFEFEANFDPKTITSVSVPTTELNVSSPNELLYCTYDFLETQPEDLSFKNEYGSDSGRISPIIQDYEDFKESYTKNFTFQKLLSKFEREKNYAYLVNVTCENPAGWTYSKEVPLNVSISGDFEIEFKDDGTYFNTNSPTINLRTSDYVTCSYVLDDGKSYTKITSEPTRDHSFKEKLDDGLHKLTVKCSSTVKTNTKTFSFTTDNGAPNLPSGSINQYQCSSNMKLDLYQVPDDGLVSYNYSIYNSSNFVKENQIFGPQATTFTQKNTTLTYELKNKKLEQNYYWQVNKVDKAGNVGKYESFMTTVKNSTGIYCDEIKPTVDVDVKQNSSTGDYIVDIVCKDSQSGCPDEYNYSFIGENESCEDNPPKTVAKYSDGPLVFNDKGKLCYAVEDNAGQVVNGSVIINDELTIELVKPRFGIASTKTYGLEIYTSKDSMCKHGYLGDQHPDEIENWYLSLKYFFSETEKTKNHLTEIDSKTIPQLDQTLSSASAPWVIICTNDIVYTAKTFEVGFDTTVPNIQISASPNPVVDPGDVSTTLKVTSDDLVVCTYLNEKGKPVGFENYDPLNKSQYKTSHQQELTYWGYSDIKINQTVACKNIAQNSITKNYSIDIKLKDEVGIHFDDFENSNYYNNSKVELNFTTEHDSTCEYRLDPNDAFKPIQGDSNNHYLSLDLEDGTYTSEVRCTSKSTGLTGTKFYTFTVDTKKPILDLIAKDESCSLDGVNITILANGTGTEIDYFKYNLSYNGTTLTSGISKKASIDLKKKLEKGETYLLEVIAFDKAENSDSKSKKIVATPYDKTLCDITPPEAKVRLEYVWSGVNTTLLCSDTGSGCAESFGYIWSTETCSNVTYSAEKYANLPLFYDQTSKFCYEAYDLSNNKVEGKKSVTVTDHCFNGIEDPFEDGVDCGGECSVLCGTCNNGIQDIFEKGVDCGGVCQTIRSCIIENSTNIITKNPIDTNGSSNGNNKDDSLTNGVCKKDSDCDGSSNYCIDGECVDKSLTDKPDTQIEDKGINPLGLILLILGLLMMGGGSYYIYYSENQRLEYLKKQQAYAQQKQSQQNEALLAQRRAEELQRLKEAKERREKGEAQREQKQTERKNQRSTVFGEFDSQDKSEEQKPQTPLNSVEIKNDPLKEESEDYIDLSQLSKDESKEDSTSVFKKLDKISKGEKIEHKDVLNQKPEGTPKVKHEQGSSFESLQKFIDATHNKQEHPSNFQEIDKIEKNVSSTDFVNIFTQEVESKHLDETTLVSLLKVLIKEGKLTIQTSKEILEKLANENFISKSSIDKLFAKINS